MCSINMWPLTPKPSWLRQAMWWQGSFRSTLSELEFCSTRWLLWLSFQQLLMKKAQHWCKPQMKIPPVKLRKKLIWIWAMSCRPWRSAPPRCGNYFCHDPETTRLPGLTPPELAIYLCSCQWISHLEMHPLDPLTTHLDPIPNRIHSEHWDHVPIMPTLHTTAGSVVMRTPIRNSV